MNLSKFKGSDNRIIFSRFSNEDFEILCSLTPFITDSSRNSIRERVYCIENGINELPKCVHCQLNILRFKTLKLGYGRFCSDSCTSSNKETIERRIKNRDSKLVSKQEELDKKFEKEEFTIHRINGILNSKRFTTAQFQHLCALTPFVSDSSRNSIRERVYCIENNITEHPKCRTCETNIVKWNNSHSKYETFCSRSCVSRTQEHKDLLSSSKANFFKSVRNSNDSDISGVVYILHFPELNAVKIGLTSDFKSRGKQLEKDFGNFNIVSIIQTEECYRLESELHATYNEYRIILEEGTGRTEFFKDEILTPFLSKLKPE